MDEGEEPDVVEHEEPSSTGWIVGIIIAVALLVVLWLVVDANSEQSAPNQTMTQSSN